MLWVVKCEHTPKICQLAAHSPHFNPFYASNQRTHRVDLRIEQHFDLRGSLV